MNHPEDDIAVSLMDELRASVAEHRAREHAAEDAEWREHYRAGGTFPDDDEPDYEDEVARRLDDDYADAAERRYERQIYGD